MPAPMVKTAVPGVFKRGSKYAVTYRDAEGRQRRESAPTFDAARLLKQKREVEVKTGTFQEASKVTFHAYALGWIDTYQGTGRHGFRDRTRDDYRRLLNSYALKHFSTRLRMTEITPRHIAAFVAWLCDEGKQGQRLSDSTVRNAVAPVRGIFKTAVREGLIRHNPMTDVALPHRPTVDEDDDEGEARPFTREQLAAVLNMAPERHRLLLRFFAATGLRFSEVVAVRWKDLRLDGSSPHVRVRRSYDSKTHKFEPPKTKHSKRNVPLPAALVSELRSWRKTTEWPDEDHLVFTTTTGTPLHYSNLRRRVLVPLVQEAGASWAGFHTFRHTAASMLFDSGRNVVQVSRFLGHHSATFTLSRYVHLMSDALPAPLNVDDEIQKTPDRCAARTDPRVSSLR